MQFTVTRAREPQGSVRFCPNLKRCQPSSESAECQFSHVPLRTMRYSGNACAPAIASVGEHPRHQLKPTISFRFWLLGCETLTYMRVFTPSQNRHRVSVLLLSHSWACNFPTRMRKREPTSALRRRVFAVDPSVNVTLSLLRVVRYLNVVAYRQLQLAGALRFEVSHDNAEGRLKLPRAVVPRAD